MRTAAVVVTLCSLCTLVPGAAAQDGRVATVASAPEGVTVSEAHRASARRAIDRAVAYLRETQDPVTGGWNAPEQDHESARRRVHLPAFTGLVINGMLLHPSIDDTDPSVRRGVSYLLSRQQDDGGVYDRLLPSYNTAVSVSALSKSDDPRARAAVRRGVAFLKGLQWSDEADPSIGGDEAPTPVAEDHPFFGGVGYGRHGRPDNSNLNLFLQAMHDAGVSPDDESFQRALTFLERTQMEDSINPMAYADGSSQGGFIYATVPNAESVDGRPGQSQAGSFEESMDDGRFVSRLRAYGSMTYAGFKSYIYAGLERDDPRVEAAYRWLREHYTLEENPGMGAQGFYYYMVTMTRALDAYGPSTIETVALDARGEPRLVTRNWREDAIDRLVALQNDDGSFRVLHERWMEDDAVLITAYSLLALQHAAGNARDAE